MGNRRPFYGTGSLQHMMKAIFQAIIRVRTLMAGGTSLTKSVRRDRVRISISLGSSLSLHQAPIGVGLKNALISYAKKARSLLLLAADHDIKGIWMNRKVKLFSPSGQISRL